MKDGGPAYPAPEYLLSKEVDQKTIIRLDMTRGMTLRDYFMAHAPDIDSDIDQKDIMLSFPELGECPKWNENAEANSIWWIKANVLYKARFADAMLAEKERLQNEEI